MFKGVHSVLSFKGQVMVQHLEDKSLIKCEDDAKVRSMVSSKDERGNIKSSSCSPEILWI